MYLKIEKNIAALFFAVCIIDAEKHFVTINPKIKSQKIIGGEAATNSEAPYHVYLKVNSHYICGGALITPQHVLTAAHCLTDIAENPYIPLTVVAGTDSRNSKGIEKRAAEIFIHPLFNDAVTRHDIGVIKLAEPFQESESIKTVKLPKEPVKPGDTVTVTGFGRYSPVAFIASNHLKKLTSVVMNCDNFIWRYLGLIGDGDICIKNAPGQGICNGDSGGPLVNTKGEIVGIASRVFACAARTPDIYTYVHRYSKFINEAINGTNYENYNNYGSRQFYYIIRFIPRSYFYFY